MNQKVVAHFLDGRLVKGHSSDFFPAKPSFHVSNEESGESSEVQVADLKAVFFVKSFEGNPLERNRRDVDRSGLGRKIQVEFEDGETLIGYTSGYSKTRSTFFVFPADPRDNNERVFVVASAAKNVKFL